MKNYRNNTIVFHPFGKRIVMLIMLFVTCLQLAIAQVQITTTPPSGANVLQVGSTKQTFTVTIKNISTGAVTLNSVTVAPFAGVVIQGNHTTDNKGITINLSNNVFTFPSAYTLAAGDSMKFTYDASAICAASGQTAKVQDNVTLVYTNQAHQAQSIPVLSDSYAILYPQLTVNNTSLQVASGNKYDLITKVSNATGAGAVDGMQLTITFPAGTDVAPSAPVLLSNSPTNWGLSLTPPVQQGSSYVYTITPGVIPIASGASFYIKQPVTVNSYFTEQQIQYAVSQMVNGTVCNTVSSSGTFTLIQGKADPQISVSLNKIIKPLSICDSNGIVRIEIKNNSTHTLSGTAFITALRLEMINFITDKISSINGIDIPFKTYYWDFTLQPQTGIDYDGVGGFGDYNNDGVYMDLNAGDSSFIDISFHTSDALRYSEYPAMSIYAYSEYNGIDNKSYTNNVNISNDYIYTSSTLDGSNDIDGTKSYTFGFKSLIKMGNMNQTLFVSSRKYYLEASVPDGFTINNQGTHLLIPVNFPVEASINVQATSQSVCGNFPIIWQLRYTEDVCNANVYTIIDTQQKMFYNHTANGCANSPNNVLSLDISRPNTGYANNITSPVFKTDLAGLTQYTESNCPNSKLYLYDDTMRLSMNAKVPASGNCLFKSIIAHFTTTQDDFTLISAKLTINGTNYSSTDFGLSSKNGLIDCSVIFTFNTGLRIENTDSIYVMALTKLKTYSSDNIQGSISTVNCTNDTLGSDIRSNSFTVLYQFPTYNEYRSFCKGQTAFLQQSNFGGYFPKEFRPIEKVSELTLTKIPGIVYNLGLVTVECNKYAVPSNRFKVSEDDSYIHIIFPDTLLLTPSDDQSISVNEPIGNTCGLSSKLNVPISSSSYALYEFNGLKSKTKTSTSENCTVPVYSFTPTSISTNNGKLVTWNTRVTNTGKIDAPNTMMEWSLAPGKTTLQLQNVTIDGVAAAIRNVGNKWYFTLAKNGNALKPNTSFDLSLTAGYISCSFNDSIFSSLRTAYSCDTITPSNFNTYVCDSFKQSLQASTANLSLVPSIPQSPSSFYNFCDTIPYSVEIFLGNTDSTKLSYWLSQLPNNISVKNNAISYSFAGNTGTLNAATIFTPNNFNISNEIVNKYSSSVPDWNQKSVKLSFYLTVECSNKLVTDITKVLSEHVSRANICGAVKDETFDFTPKIRGFENLSKIKIAAVAHGFNNLQQADVTVTTSNIHTSLVDSVNITATLPQGVHYVSSTDVAQFETITATPNADSSTTVVWAFDRGKYVQGQSSVDFKTHLLNTLACSKDSAKIIFISSLQRKVLACNGKDSCLATAGSDTAIVYLKRNPPLYISSLIYPDTVCNGITDTIKVKTIGSNTVLAFTTNAGTINANGTFTLNATFTGKAQITIDASGQGCHQDTTIYITVIAPTPISITSVPQLRSTDPSITLSATPAGGTWSGAGVVGTTFNPSIGVGTHYVTYTTKKANGQCQVKDSIAIIVKNVCSINYMIKDQNVCFPDTVHVPISINDIAGCGGCANTTKFVILYDASKLQFNNNYTFTNKDNADIFVTEVSLGKIVVQLYKYTYTKTSLFTTGVLLYLHFTPLSLGSSDISFSNSFTTDGQGNNLPFLYNTGKITVVAPPTVSITNPSGSICNGSQITLTAKGATTYLWNNDSVATIQTFNPTHTSDYSVTGIDAKGCSGTATTEIVVNALPTIIATSNPSAICVGASSTISASGGISYVWNNGIGTASSVVTPIGTTTYTVSGTNANGCSSIANTTVTVNPLSTLVVSASQSICVGSLATISASGASNFAWSNGLGSGASKTVSPTITTIYTVTGTSLAGCTSIAYTTVTVNPLPTVVASASQTICVGALATISASGATNYAWSNGLGSGSSKAVSPTTTTIYTVTGTSLAGCSSIANTTVTVNPLPTVVASASQTICVGALATISASGASNYAWSNGLGSGSAKTISPSITTIYTVTGTSLAGCSSIANTTVTVNPLPTVIASASVPTICLGKQTTVQANGAISYVWNPSAGVVSPTISTTYSVTGTDANGCKNIANTKITVNQIPTVTISPTTASVCLGTSTIITAGGAISYLWSNALTTAAITISPTSTISYTVTGTDASGCSNIASKSVTVNSLPSVTVNSGTLNNNTFTLIATATGTPTLSYNWSNGALSASTTVTSAGTYTVTVTNGTGCKAIANGTVTAASPISLPPTIDVCNPQTGVLLNVGNFSTYQWSTPQGSATWNNLWAGTNGKYTVTVTNNGGQKFVASSIITIHPQPIVSISGVVNNTVTNCPGVPFILNATSGFSQYSWNGVASTNASYTTNATGNVTLVATDANGCTTNSININLQNVSVPQAVISQTGVLTGSNSVSLTITDGSFTQFAWSTGATSRTISVNSAGIYTVTATTSNGCHSITSITETLNTTPLSIIKQSTTNGITLIAQPNNYQDYRWFNVTSNIGGGSSINVTSAGTYRVDVYQNGVFVTSTTVVVTLDASSHTLKNDVISSSDNDNTTINDEPSNVLPTVTEINSVTIVPQPAKNEIRVVSTSPVKSVLIYDMNGKMVISVKNSTVIDISTLPSATYIMMIETEVGIVTKAVDVIK